MRVFAAGPGRKAGRDSTPVGAARLALAAAPLGVQGDHGQQRGKAVPDGAVGVPGPKDGERRHQPRSGLRQAPQPVWNGSSGSAMVEKSDGGR
jgi:hypothetical protein